MTLMTIDASHYPSNSRYANGSAATGPTNAAAEAYQVEIEEETDELLRQEDIQLRYLGFKFFVLLQIFSSRAKRKEASLYSEENVGLYSMDIKL